MLQADDFVYPEQLFPSAEPFRMPLSCLLKQGVPAVENILVVAEMDSLLDGGKDFPFHGFRYFSLPNISEVFFEESGAPRLRQAHFFGDGLDRRASWLLYAFKKGIPVDLRKGG